MSHKKKDILDDILSSPPDESAPGLEGLAAIIHRSYRVESSMAEQRRSSSAHSVRPPKRRATHYISEDVFAELGLVKEKIADLFADDCRHRISRSDVVNQALRVVLEEFEIKGLDSPLVAKIISAVKRKAKRLKDERAKKAERDKC